MPLAPVSTSTHHHYSLIEQIKENVNLAQLLLIISLKRVNLILEPARRVMQSKQIVKDAQAGVFALNAMMDSS